MTARLFLLSLSLILGLPFATDAQTARATAEPEVQKVLFAEVVKSLESNWPGRHFPAYFVSLGDDPNPPSGLLEKLGKYKAPLRPASESRQTAVAIVDPVSGKSAALLFVSKLEFPSETKVVASYGWYTDSLGGRYEKVEVEWNDGAWIITKRLESIII